MPLIYIKNQETTAIFIENQKVGGNKLKPKIEIIGNQPPKNNKTHNADIIKIPQYSDKKNKANKTDEYSTL